jgi:hypothetical protein
MSFFSNIGKLFTDATQGLTSVAKVATDVPANVLRGTLSNAFPSIGRFASSIGGMLGNLPNLLSSVFPQVLPMLNMFSGAGLGALASFLPFLKNPLDLFNLSSMLGPTLHSPLQSQNALALIAQQQARQLLGNP